MANTKQEDIQEDEFFSPENEAQGNFFKFEKVGDKIKGTLVGKREQKGENGFQDQMIFELKLEDGSYCNVGIGKSKKFVIERMRRAVFGQRVGFLFSEEIPSKTKGYANAKSIRVYLGAMDENYKSVDTEQEFNGEVKKEEDPFA